MVCTDNKVLYYPKNIPALSPSVAHINYTDALVQASGIAETDLQLLHLLGGSWRTITVSRDPGANQICGSTGSFSPFAIGILPAAPCGLTLPVLLTWHCNPVLAGLDLMYGPKEDPQSTDAPFQVTDSRGEAQFICLPAGEDYMLRVKWGEPDGVHGGLTETFDLRSEGTIAVRAEASTLELRTAADGRTRLRTDIAWLRGGEVGILPHQESP